MPGAVWKSRWTCLKRSFGDSVIEVLSSSIVMSPSPSGVIGVAAMVLRIGRMGQTSRTFHHLFVLEVGVKTLRLVVEFRRPLVKSIKAGGTNNGAGDRCRMVDCQQMYVQWQRQVGTSRWLFN